MLRGSALLARFVFMLVFIVSAVACLPRLDSTAPSITIKPDAGGANTQVLIAGTGFPPNTALSLRLGPPDVGATPQSYGQVITDSRGALSLMFFVPAQWPDGAPMTENELLIVIINKDGSVKATAPFEFRPEQAAQPQLLIQPGNGAPGQRINVTGENFAPFAQLALRLGVTDTGLSSVNLAEIQTDAQGIFEAELVLPLTWPGSDAPVIEQELVIAALDQTRGQTLATAPFFNTAEGATPTD